MERREGEQQLLDPHLGLERYSASRELQDRLLAETHRVLKPGGWFSGSDSTSSFRFRLFHLFDTCVPVAPGGFADRLRAAGFDEITIEERPEYNTFKFRARKD